MAGSGGEGKRAAPPSDPVAGSPPAPRRRQGRTGAEPPTWRGSREPRRPRAPPAGGPTAPVGSSRLSAGVQRGVVNDEGRLHRPVLGAGERQGDGLPGERADVERAQRV